MRNIKFRGKRKDNGEWVEGYYLYVEEQNKHYILTGELKSYPVDYVHPALTEQGFEWVEVKEETVCQYTGLQDKNGVEIYEGDICACFCGTQIFSVEYCEERCGYFFDDCVICGDAEPMPECLGNLRNTIEVIGNIYDNPELLEGYKNE